MSVLRSLKVLSWMCGVISIHIEAERLTNVQVNLQKGVIQIYKSFLDLVGVYWMQRIVRLLKHQQLRPAERLALAGVLVGLSKHRHFSASITSLWWNLILLYIYVRSFQLFNLSTHQLFSDSWVQNPKWSRYLQNMEIVAL